jgi:WhiB family redox-sensing transcriptional regulator
VIADISWLSDYRGSDPEDMQSAEVWSDDVLGFGSPAGLARDAGLYDFPSTDVTTGPFGVDLTGEPDSWQASALCAQTDPEAFFPEKGGSTREAKKICTSCTVRTQCLELALANDERFGIWGGLSERERRRIRRAG